MQDSRRAPALIVGILLALATLVVGPPAHAVDCNDIIPAGSRVTLDPATDFTSGPCLGTGLTIIGPADVDMGGVIVHGQKSQSQACIILGGSGVTLRNGGTYACEGGIYVGGTGGHTISNMAVHESVLVGVGLLTDRNKVKDNVVNLVADFPDPAIAGIIVAAEAAGNKIQGNLITGVIDGYGIEVDGPGTKLKDNRVVGSKDGLGTVACYLVVAGAIGTRLKGDIATGCGEGFRVEADETKIDKCSALGNSNGIVLNNKTSPSVKGVQVKKCATGGNDDGGIFVEADDARIVNNVVLANFTGIRVNFVGAGNLISGNTVVGNLGADIEDNGLAPDCPATYTNNTFGTSDGLCAP